MIQQPYLYSKNVHKQALKTENEKGCLNLLLRHPPLAQQMTLAKRFYTNTQLLSIVYL